MRPLVGRLLLLGALAVSVAIVIAGACAPQGQTGPAASSGPPAPTATTSPLATPTPTAAASSRAPSATPGPPVTSCPASTGGSEAAQAQLSAVRVAHQPGFDRIVFELGPAPAGIGEPGMPPYRITTATSFTAISGQPVPIDGNAYLSVRFQNASRVDPNTGTLTYTGSSDLRPGLAEVREVKLVEDFERVMIWGIGLDHLACPAVSVLRDPVRLVVDVPAAP